MNRGTVNNNTVNRGFILYRNSVQFNSSVIFHGVDDPNVADSAQNKSKSKDDSY